MKRWRTALSWLFFLVAALWLASTIFDAVTGRPFAFPLLMAVMFGVLGILWRILAARQAKL